MTFSEDCQFIYVVIHSSVMYCSLCTSTDYNRMTRTAINWWLKLCVEVTQNNFISDAHIYEMKLKQTDEIALKCFLVCLGIVSGSLTYIFILC